MQTNLTDPKTISIHPPPCGGGTGLFAYYYIIFRFQSTHPVQSGTLGSISQTAGNFNPRGPEQISPKAQVFISPYAALSRSGKIPEKNNTVP